MALDNCKGCGERVKDFDPDGFEGADAQRGHFACGQVPVAEVTMSVTVSLHAAGCLPDSDTYPVEFESAREAWAYVEDEVEQIEDDGDYLAAHTALHLIDRDQAGSIPAGADTTYAYTVEVN